jgi:hypothetical protein
VHWVGSVAVDIGCSRALRVAARYAAHMTPARAGARDFLVPTRPAIGLGAHDTSVNPASSTAHRPVTSRCRQVATSGRSEGPRGSRSGVCFWLWL